MKVLFLDPRIYKIDFLPYLKSGIKIDLHPDAFNIPKTGIKKHDVVIATEVWDPNIIKTLEYIRKQNIPIVLIPREQIKLSFLVDDMFGKPYFKPDVVFAAGKAYADLWKDTKTIITGYPRFDWYIHNRPDPAVIRKKYGLTDKPILYFIDYPPYVGKQDLYQAREATLQALHQYALERGQQVVVKAHPFTWKPFLKHSGRGNEVKGLLLERYLNPTEHMKVIGDDRFNGDIAKELLCAADQVIGYNSTMLLEAGIIGKPVIQANFSGVVSEWDDKFDTASTQEDLFTCLGNPRQVDKRLIEHYLGKIDGCSWDRINKSLASIASLSSL